MNLYENLDLSADPPPTAGEIKRAYRKAAKAAHPDTPTGSSEKFQKLTRAYLVLSDPARRQRYDATGDIDEQTVDNTLSQAVSIIVGAVMSAVDGYVKNQSPDPSTVDLVDGVRAFVKGNIAEFEKQKNLMEKAQASLRDIAKRWSVKKKSAFLKQALDQQAASTAQPLAKISQQIETYKLALELLANSSFDPAGAGQYHIAPGWRSVYSTTGTS